MPWALWLLALTAAAPAAERLLAIDFETGRGGVTTLGQATVSLTPDGAGGTAIECRPTARGAGLRVPCQIAGAAGAVITFRVRANDWPRLQVNLFDEAAGDNTTTDAQRDLTARTADGEPDWVLVRLDLETFRYNSAAGRRPGDAARFTSLTIHAPEPTPATWLQLDDLVVHRGVDTVPPATPEAPRPVEPAAGDTTAQLTWQPVTDDIGVAGYLVRAVGTNGVAPQPPRLATRPAATIERGPTAVDVQVAALDTSGNCSGWSPPCRVGARPGATPAAAGPPARAAMLAGSLAERRGGRSDTVLLYGDSLTNAAVYQRECEARLGRYRVVAHAHPGQTTTFAAQRAVETLDEVKPALAVILFGTNDLRRRTATPEQVAGWMANLEAVAQAAVERGCVPILCTVPPVAGGDPTPELTFNVALRELAAGRYPLADYHAALAEADGRPRPGVLAPDGIHWQTEGMQAAAASLVAGGPASPLRLAEACLWPSPQETDPMNGLPPVARPRLRQVLTVRTEPELRRAIADAPDGTHLVLAPGVYQLPRLLFLHRRDDILIEGCPEDPSQVVLRGRDVLTVDDQDDILRIGQCRRITVRGLTFENCHAYGLKIQAENEPEDIIVEACRFINFGTRGLKGSTRPGAYARRGLIQGCWFQNSFIPPSDWIFNGDYVSGIDMMALDGWTVRDCDFRDIKGANGAARGAIFLWVDSRNLVVESNRILGCDRGIALGNPSSSSHGTADLRHVTGALVRNNVVRPGPDAGIELARVQGVQVVHNTVLREQPVGRGIRAILAVDDTLIAGNLVHGAILVEQPTATPRLEGNLTGDLAAVVDLTDPLGRLRPGSPAIATGEPHPAVVLDHHGRRRGPRPDLGASEFAPE